MAETVNQRTVNEPGDDDPWGVNDFDNIKEYSQLFPDQGETWSQNRHDHSRLTSPTNSSPITAIDVVASGLVQIHGDTGTLPTLSSDTFFAVNNNSAAGDNIEMSLNSGATGKCTINFGDTADEDAGSFEWDNGGSGTLRIFNGATERVRITSSGFSIGGIAPATDFYVEGSTNEIARFKSSDDLCVVGFRDDDTNGNLVAKDSTIGIGLNASLNAGNLNITSTGAGIGVTAPAAKFHSLATTEQLRLGFDAASYISFTVADSLAVSTLNITGTTELDFQAGANTVITIADNEGAALGFFAVTATARVSAYTRNATVVTDKTLLASGSATTINNNNVLAAIIADLQAYGLFQGT